MFYDSHVRDCRKENYRCIRCGQSAVIEVRLTRGIDFYMCFKCQEQLANELDGMAAKMMKEFKVSTTIVKENI